MPFVAILGAGNLGGALTYTLASRARFDEVRLIDPAGTVAVGKALDIRQAGPPDGYGTRVTGHVDLAAAAGAWVLVLADLLAPVLPAHGQSGDAGDLTSLLRPVTGIAPGAILVCADASHAPLLRRLVGEGVSAPDLLVGSAPGAAVSAARSLVALATSSAPSEVAVGLRSAPETTLPDIDWQRVSVRGRPADDLLTAEQRNRVDHQLAAAWPPGPFALAAAAARVTEAAWFGCRRTYTAWVADRALGADGTGLADIVFDTGGRMRPAVAR